MAKKMLIDATHPEETRVVVVDGSRIEEFDYETITKLQLSGNIYLAKVTRVEPSLQAAFVEYGGGRHGFLAFNEIHPDYYQIPVADREALKAAQRAAAAEADFDDEDDGSRSRRGGRQSDDRDRAADNEDGRRRRRRREPRSKSLTLAPLTDVALPQQLTSAPEGLRVEAPSAAALAEAAAAAPAPAPEPEAVEPAPEGADAEIEHITVGEGTTDGPADPSVLAESAGADAVERVAAEAPDLSANAEANDEPVTDAVILEETEATTADGAGDAAEAPAEIEELGADDMREELPAARRPRLRDYRIQEVIKRRQILLVQVVKEERGTKGAALTTYLSLAGRYCVLMPNTDRGGGISRKITNAADRKRLKSVTQELEVPSGMGLIVRTAGANRTKAEIKRDFEYLLRQWSAIRELTLNSIAPSLIYEEGSLVKRAIRDLYNKDIEAIQVEGDEGYREAKDYMKMLMPSHAKYVQPHRDMAPLFSRHQVESQIGAMMNPTVPLKSGGYLVIGVTEALVAIDVNSGRSTKEGSIEETALKTNLEAAEEAARQMRLRDLAGLIVIDFIDMEEPKNNRAVEKRLKDRLKDDRARIQVGRISGFGLLEMSRQRLRPGLLEATTRPCPHCNGTGVVRSEESLALTILRAVEEEGAKGRSAAVRVTAPVSVANYLMNHKRARIGMVEHRHAMQVLIEGDATMISPDFNTERVKPIAREEPASQAIQMEAGYEDLDAPEEDEEAIEAERAREHDAVSGDAATSDEAEAAPDDLAEKPRRRRRRRRDRDGDDAGDDGGPRGDDDAPITPNGGAAADDAEATEGVEIAAGAEDAEDGDGGEVRRRRGKRGGRRRRRKDEEDEAVAERDQAEGEPTLHDDEIASRHEAAAEAADAPLGETAVSNGAAEPPSQPPQDADIAAGPAANLTADTSVDTAHGLGELEIIGAEPAPPPPPPDRAPSPSRPKRTGWWSFGRS
ncbi:MAG: Rne/Rng family ribonuclease [Pseudomonadota bacterium]